MPIPETTILATHAAATVFMTGVIWFVQLVHYPLMGAVGAEAFARYEREHQRRTTWVVCPAMLIEAATAAWLVALVPTDPLRLAGAGLLVLVWISTFGVQAPLHRALEAGFDTGTLHRLVGTNWVRTVAWSARSVIGLAMLAAAAASV